VIAKYSPLDKKKELVIKCHPRKPITTGITVSIIYPIGAKIALEETDATGAAQFAALLTNLPLN
jgi:hypothetical protein